jgi:hypothetical protein
MELFHVTDASAAESILRDGFEPRIGPRSTELVETVPATYFFPSEADLIAASWNWLSEAFEDVVEPVIVLVVAVQPDLVHIDPAVGFEVVVKVPVPASAIVRAYDFDSGRMFVDSAVHQR